MQRTTRRELIAAAAAGALAATAGASSAAARTRVQGAARYAGRELKNTLRIAQWSHFVPAYDKWFDSVYTRRWGEANDTEVIVDHVNQALLPARAASEVATAPTTGRRSASGPTRGSTSCRRRRS